MGLYNDWLSEGSGASSDSNTYSIGGGKLITHLGLWLLSAKV